MPETRLLAGDLLLRPFAANDVEENQACADPLIQQWLPLPQPYTRQNSAPALTRRPGQLRSAGSDLSTGGAGIFLVLTVPMRHCRSVGRSRKQKGLAAVGRRLQREHDEDWVSLGSSEDQATAMAQAWRRLTDLGVDLPPRSTRRDFWAAGIADTDIRIDHFYLGPERGVCAIQISVRRAALDSARRY
ncbi:hypothetical protein ACGFIR_27705 [Micromonospora sp. NPDC049051]|uniref:hypothetical protein n=1 Tax=unclassified Micromonospora TaxID=2617518 RepID=UPI0037109CFC